MYEGFYGLREQPFRVTPDPRFLFRTPAIDEAVAALTYGVEQRKGFLSLVGEVGTGKTTLLRHLLDSLPPSTQTVLILYPTVQFEEMLEHILHELGIPSEGAGKFIKLQRLHEFLLEHTRAGGNSAIVIDEAQDLDARVLEELRLLSNLETGTEKILQILLSGQPELERKLAQTDLRQLRQRIALHVRLRALAAPEVAAYVQARLERAGGDDAALFDAEALAYVAFVTEGIPRLINVLCDAALVTGFAAGAPRITRPLVEEAWADYAHLAPPPAPPPPPAPAHDPAAVTGPAEPAFEEPAAPPAPEVDHPPHEPPVPTAVEPSPADADDEAGPPRHRRSARWLVLMAGSLIAAASLFWARAG
jgi:general secretion pathway protein A